MYIIKSRKALDVSGVAKLPGDSKGFFLFVCFFHQLRRVGGLGGAAGGRARRDVPECGRSGSRTVLPRGVPSRCLPQPGAMAVVLGSSAGQGREQQGLSWGWGWCTPSSWEGAKLEVGGMLHPYPSGSGGITLPRGLQAGGRGTPGVGSSWLGPAAV